MFLEAPWAPNKHGLRENYWMIAAQRRQQIMARLRISGQVRTRDLAEAFDVSDVTIRNDLDILDSEGDLKKTHGGAVSAPLDTPDAAFDRRMQVSAVAKERIARLAAQQFEGNQTVIFDSGSTMMNVAMHMPPVQNVVVATPAMNIAQLLMGRPGLDVHLFGGRVDASTVSTLVSQSQSATDGLVAHQVFMAAHAIDTTLDVVDLSEDVARSKRNLIQMARRVVLVADSAKWGISATSKAFALSRVDLVITDSDMPPTLRKRLRKQGVDVLYA